MDLNHPDFAGRVFVTNSFVGQPVQDLHSHGTHCIGTSCGPKAPSGNIQRYGIAFKSRIYAGKVLTNSGSGTTASVLAGMNWAIANRCAVISMSLGSQSPIQAAYTAAGNLALANGCLIVAAAGNDASNTGAPANSPSIMSVASLDAALVPSAFLNFGKVEIAAPGRDIFSSVPMPTRYGIIVTVSPDRPLAEVAKELTRAGFSIEQTLEEIGVITGTCAAGSVKKFKAIKGVLDVSGSTRIDIGPPESPIS